MSISLGRFTKRRRSYVGQMPAVFAIVMVGLLAVSARGQQQKQPAPKTDIPDEVVRVSTELVQTGVTVVDKKGKFVDNLRRDDFEILVDDKPQPISFFELVKTTAPPPKSGPGKVASSSASTDEETASRIVLFFIDDLHLSVGSVVRTRKMLEYYIDQQMGQDDQAVIASASGQIGFLQQLTDSKEALHAAVARLKYRATTAADTDRPPMSEYQASMIERGDEDLLNHFTSILLSELFRGLTMPPAPPAQLHKSTSRFNCCVTTEYWFPVSKGGSRPVAKTFTHFLSRKSFRWPV